jgi:salicylate hydroxylase
MRAVVVGAGIGGLAATLSLRRAGHEVTLVEQAARFTEIGAGIQLAPNATRLLRRLGLLDAVAAQAARPSHVSFRTWSDGAEICRYALGRAVEDAFGAPYLLLHRADLHQALAAAVPPSSVRLNTVVVGIDQDDGSASVTTASGERLRADLVVAADGIRSAARQWLFGADEAVFSGTVAYRALLPAGEVADLGLPDLGIWLGPGRHFVHYWVRRGELLNVVAVFTAEAQAEALRLRLRRGMRLGLGLGRPSRGPLGRNRASSCASSTAGTPASSTSSNARARCSATASTRGCRSRGGTSAG